MGFIVFESIIIKYHNILISIIALQPNFAGWVPYFQPMRIRLFLFELNKLAPSYDMKIKISEIYFMGTVSSSGCNVKLGARSWIKSR